MGIIKVTDIKVFAHHGCLKEETVIGSDYRIDVEVEANLKTSAKSDELKDTVDYVLINRIVKGGNEYSSKTFRNCRFENN